jgi:hypothetical protein
MLGFLVAVFFFGVAAVVLSFAVYGIFAFSLACRQNRQGASCCSWSEAWDVVMSQWHEHITCTGESPIEPAVDPEPVTPTKRVGRPRKTSDTPKAPRTRKPRNS